MHRFFVDPQTLAGPRVVLQGPLRHQIKDVLRLAAGERIVLLDGSGYEYEVVLTGVGRDVVEGEVTGKALSAAEPRTNVRLYQGILKGARFELVLQKGTELGVSAFIPVIFQRGIAAGDLSAAKFERWGKIVTEAAEQSGRAILPEVSRAMPFAAALEQAPGLGIIPWEEEHETGLREALENWDRSETGDRSGKSPLVPLFQRGKDVSTPLFQSGRDVSAPLFQRGRDVSTPLAQRGRDVSAPLSQRGRRSISIFIGPEGGITREEIGLAVAGGVIPVSLGPRILRAETAPLAVVAAVMYHYGELGPVRSGTAHGPNP